MDKAEASENLGLRKRKPKMVPRVRQEESPSLESNMAGSTPSLAMASESLIGANSNNSNQPSKYLHTKRTSSNANGSVAKKDVAETNLNDISNGEGIGGSMSYSDDDDNMPDNADSDTCRLLPSSGQPREEDESKVIVEDEVRLRL
ncbi:hypothetical protein PoB_002000400 [Plakobranchus ocellatus]|uniref:Uncharacterized protein n=1 Tax=Plakobranchus ocellatus TaxID=259542 RepID=A0AAV3ZGK9_9GAST|nr:hypothetical protein PoB_002000400 [Plakobranchus ocellatus]